MSTQRQEVPERLCKEELPERIRSMGILRNGSFVSSDFDTLDCRFAVHTSFIQLVR